jgi:hypothetical protein
VKKYLLTTPGVRDREYIWLPGFVDHGKVCDQASVKYLMQSSGLGYRILRYSAPPCSLGGTRGW